MTHSRNPVYPLALEAEVIEALRTVYDPEIPVNIYELGLIYEIDVDDMGDVDIDMTLTSPACPVAGTLPGQVEAKVARSKASPTSAFISPGSRPGAWIGCPRKPNWNSASGK